ncbi:unnamed protein product [Caenorhabditis sp. 36 PRJEB53466]|nr:unnamed protein product [Caenorhabditis sp. 36 PRJEB53466]
MLHVDLADSLYSETVRVTASGLEEWTSYQLVLRLYDSNKSSNAVFQSDSLGFIDLSRDAPLRGSYHDVNPMGLFTSPLLSAEAIGTTTCCYYRLEILDSYGHHVDGVNLKRRFLHPLVTRIAVEDSELSGLLYKPPGNGPFPSVIVSKRAERMAMKLASQGFLVFSALLEMKSLEYVLNLPYSNGKLGVMRSSNFLAIQHLLTSPCQNREPYNIAEVSHETECPAEMHQLTFFGGKQSSSHESLLNFCKRSLGSPPDIQDWNREKPVIMPRKTVFYSRL